MAKTIGIIGGMGSLATVDLFQRVVLNTDAKSDQEHIHIIIDNNTSIPDRTAYILKDQESPLEQLIASAVKLEKIGADFLIMPCNTAHYFCDEIKREVSIPLISMIEETAKYIKENYPDKQSIGLLGTEGTIKSQIYDLCFSKLGLKIIKPGSENQQLITDVIYGVKKGETNISKDNLYEAVEELKAKDAEIFILGCTELSVINNLYKLKGEFIDPLTILTKRSIELAGKRIK